MGRGRISLSASPLRHRKRQKRCRKTMEAEEKKPQNKKRRRRCAGKGKTKKCRKGGEGRGENRLSSLSLIHLFPPVFIFLRRRRNDDSNARLDHFSPLLARRSREKLFAHVYISGASFGIFSPDCVCEKEMRDKTTHKNSLSLRDTLTKLHTREK